MEFSDNGGGVEEPKRVFEPFYTTFNEKKGLGLTFVFHAVQAMNGEIAVENVGDGAKITLKIPADDETGD
jgi:signal transduction histidine kinase